MVYCSYPYVYCCSVCKMFSSYFILHFEKENHNLVLKAIYIVPMTRLIVYMSWLRAHFFHWVCVE